MRDTSDEMYKIQHDIFMQKPAAERFRLNCELTDWVWLMAYNRIKKKHPDLSEGEIIILRFKEFYHDVFSEKEIENITQSIRNHWLNKQNQHGTPLHLD